MSNREGSKGGCERRIEVIVKMQKKSGGGGGGGGVDAGKEVRNSGLGVVSRRIAVFFYGFAAILEQLSLGELRKSCFIIHREFMLT